MRYQANPVIVEAFRIASVVGVTDNGTFELILDNAEHVGASPGMTARMIPVVGDYWVIQSDGYIYLNPKDIFECKYSPLQENAESA